MGRARLTTLVRFFLPKILSLRKNAAVAADDTSAVIKTFIVLLSFVPFQLPVCLPPEARRYRSILIRTGQFGTSVRDLLQSGAGRNSVLKNEGGGEQRGCPRYDGLVEKASYHGARAGGEAGKRGVVHGETVDRGGGAREGGDVTPCARSPIDFPKKARTGDKIGPEAQFSKTNRARSTQRGLWAPSLRTPLCSASNAAR